MKILTSREQILPFVRNWVELLAQDNYEKAVEVLYSSAEAVWTPHFLRHVMANYGMPKTRRDRKVFQVTSIASATLAPNATVILEHIEWFSPNDWHREWQQLPEHVRFRLFRYWYEKWRQLPEHVRFRLLGDARLNDFEIGWERGWEQLPEHVNFTLFNDTLGNNSQTLRPVGLVFHALPVNGQWSDLTGIFWINALGENYVLQLEDMALNVGDMQFL